MRLIKIFCFILLLAFQTAYSQWEFIENGMYMVGSYWWGGVYDIQISGDNIFAATMGSGVFRSTNNGDNWVRKSSGLTNIYVYAIAIKNNYIFAGTRKGVFLSTNNGENWVPKSSGLNNDTVYCFAVDGDKIFTGTNNGVYLSTDNGENWISKNSGLTGSYFRNISIGNNSIWVSNNDGIFRSTDNGDSWTAKNSGLPYSIISGKLSYSPTAIAISGKNIFVGIQYEGIYLSTDDGESWIQKNERLWDTRVAAITINGDSILVGTNEMGGALYISTNNGNQWNLVWTGYNGQFLRCITASTPNIFMGTDNCVLLSTNGGNDWALKKSGLFLDNSLNFVIHDNLIFASYLQCGIFSSSNYGDSWTEKSNGLPIFLPFNKEFGLYNGITSIAVIKNNIIVGVDNSIYLSSNNGDDWFESNNGFPYDIVWNLSVIDTNIFLSSMDNGIFLSTDYGNSWQAKNSGFSPDISEFAKMIVYQFIAINDRIYAVLGRKTMEILITTDYGDHWTLNTDFPVGVMVLAVKGDNILAGTLSGVFLSSDNGKNWVQTNLSARVNSLKTADNYIFAATDAGVFLSTDDGKSWIAKNDGILNDIAFNLTIFDDYIFASTDGGMYRAKISDLITDIKDTPEPTDAITIFPNPAMDNLYIKIPPSSPMISAANYSILNILGQTVQSGTLGEIGSEGRISVASLPSGMYFLILKDGHMGTYLPLKFVKE